MDQTARVLSDRTNLAVVQLPGRRFPGSVVQGDSLAQLLALAREAKEGLAQNDRPAASDAVDLLIEALEERLSEYERVLDQHGLPRPY